MVEVEEKNPSLQSFRAFALFRCMECRSNCSKIGKSSTSSSIPKKKIEPNERSSAADLQLKVMFFFVFCEIQSEIQGFTV